MSELGTSAEPRSPSSRSRPDGRRRLFVAVLACAALAAPAAAPAQTPSRLLRTATTAVGSAARATAGVDRAPRRVTAVDAPSAVTASSTVYRYLSLAGMHAGTRDRYFSALYAAQAPTSGGAQQLLEAEDEFRTFVVSRYGVQLRTVLDSLVRYVDSATPDEAVQKKRTLNRALMPVAGSSRPQSKAIETGWTPRGVPAVMFAEADPPPADVGTSPSTSAAQAPATVPSGRLAAVADSACNGKLRRWNDTYGHIYECGCFASAVGAVHVVDLGSQGGVELLGSAILRRELDLSGCIDPVGLAAYGDRQTREVLRMSSRTPAEVDGLARCTGAELVTREKARAPMERHAYLQGQSMYNLFTASMLACQQRGGT